MVKSLVFKFLAGCFTVFAVSFAVFVVIRIIGDPVAMFLPPGATKADIEQMRKQLGLDAPVLLQYLQFLKKACQGDFGMSLFHNVPAMPLLLQRIPATFQLMMVAVFLTVVIGIPLGTIAAYYSGSIIDILTSITATLGQSTPNFWLAILLIQLFAVRLKILPATGRLPGWGSWKSVVLPGVTIALLFAPAIARITRNTVLEIMSQDFVRTARAKGLSEGAVLCRHVLRNVLIPVSTVLGLQMGNLFGGTVVIETVFMWPGLGLFTIYAISNRDFPVIQAAVILMAVFIVFINALLDVLYTIFDPRLRET